MAGNGRLDLVHQNAIHVETIRKAQKYQKLHTEFSINPRRKCESASRPSLDKILKKKFACAAFWNQINLHVLESSCRKKKYIQGYILQFKTYLAMIVINRWICYNPAVHTVCQRLLLHCVPVFSQCTSCQTNQWQRNQLRWSKRTVSPRRRVKTSAERSRHISRIWALERLVVDRFYFILFIFFKRN